MGLKFILGAVVAAAIAAPAGTAHAQSRPTFPAALEGEPLTAWLRRETDITPTQVVAISPSALTAVIAIYPEPPGSRIVVRAEAVSAEAQAREGVLSWAVTVSTDCKARKVRLGETNGYPERNLIGARRQIRPAEPDWRAFQPGTALESVWRLACDTKFRRPLVADAAPEAKPASPAAPPPARAAATPPKAAPPAPKAPPPAPKPAAPAPKPAAAARPAAPAADVSGATVQISASGSEAGAQADLAAVRRRFGKAVAGRDLRVEKADVRGQTVYRAVVAGFASPAEAQRACEALKALGQGCFVRGR